MTLADVDVAILWFPMLVQYCTTADSECQPDCWTGLLIK